LIAKIIYKENLPARRPLTHNSYLLTPNSYPMTSQETPTSFTAKITSYLPTAEKIFMVALAIGCLLKYLGTDLTVMAVSLVGLAVTFFFSAFRQAEIIPEENERFTFNDLLAYEIVPKVLWISCAVSTMGVLLFFFGNQGAKRMLFIGGTSIIIGTVILIGLLISGAKHISAVLPVLYRAIPLLVLDLYLFFG
jgi:hypothetical protein